MMAAIAAAEHGHQVQLFEKNEKLGKKIYITGKGRCNVTNACDTEELFAAVVHNPKFLYSSFYSFTNRDIMELVEKNIRPRDIMTPEAFQNALTVDMALGCSTNTMLHLPAIAREAGVEPESGDRQRDLRQDSEPVPPGTGGPYLYGRSE